MKTEWVKLEEQEPENRQMCLVAVRQRLWEDKYANTICAAEYIRHKEVEGPEFLDYDSCDSDFEVYDEEEDKYYAPKGFYESQVMGDTSFFIDHEILAWMPLKEVLQEATNK